MNNDMKDRLNQSLIRYKFSSDKAEIPEEKFARDMLEIKVSLILDLLIDSTDKDKVRKLVEYYTSEIDQVSDDISPNSES